MRYIEGQIEQTKGYIAYWQASIVSGGYKLRKLSRGCEKSPEYPDGWKPLTDEEKLQDALSILQTHCDRLGKLIEHLPTGDDGGTGPR